MGYGDVVPQTALGQIVGMALMSVSLVIIAAFTSLLSSQLTAAALAGLTVKSLDDLPTNARLCIENGYELAARFAEASNRPYSYNTIEHCMDALSTGSVGAVLHDIAILDWYQSQFGTSSRVYTSPPLAINPVVVFYAAGSPLHAWANPAIAATSSDPTLAAVGAALERKYLSSSGRSSAADDESTYSPSLGFTLLGFVIITYSARIRFLLADLRKNLPATLRAGVYWGATMGKRIRGVDVDGLDEQARAAAWADEKHVAAPVEHSSGGSGRAGGLATRAEMVFESYDEEDWTEPSRPPPPVAPPPPAAAAGTSWLWGSTKPTPAAAVAVAPQLPASPLRERAQQRRARDEFAAAEVELRQQSGGGRSPRSVDAVEPSVDPNTVIWSTFKPKGGGSQLRHQ